MHLLVGGVQGRGRVLLQPLQARPANPNLSPNPITIPDPDPNPNPNPITIPNSHPNPNPNRFSWGESECGSCFTPVPGCTIREAPS